ncbi:hypothetical protein [Haloactinomyces albus]|uniref:Uncharacterized protein n=1 Tax=Haloactinomyces albus TaxID=1352928 RepID=A0AAE3ZDE8_9ACTN|nr:hypothetical protein [Haloactinomyces albus]MDR7301741.1 hypothetical protein [Haloactinomyces albus]
MDAAEGVGPAGRLHNLVLAMTGRVDDDAVNSARGMLGAGHLGAAAELLAGCLLAGRIPVTPTEQYHLRWVLERTRSRPALADRLYVAEMPPVERHRFGAPETPDDDIAEALRPAARRLTSVRALWCVSRKTPAGVAYGAVPRRVLLAEVDSEEAVTAAGYQILAALERASIGCSVDVFSSGTDLPEYHRNALASARQVDPVPEAGNGSERARASRRSSGGEPAGDTVDDPAAESPVRVPPAGFEFPVADVVSDPSQAPARMSELSVVNVALADSSPRAAERFAEEAIGETVAEFTEEAAGEADVLHSEVVAGPAAAGPAVDGPAVDEDAVGALSEVGTEGEVIGAPEEHRGPGANPRVPAAVDAKLTDRERNLLRKLHEELAQREQDKDGSAEDAGGQVTAGQVADEPRSNGRTPHGQAPEGQQNTLSGNRQDPRLTTMPGTGGFPPIGAAPASVPGRRTPPSASH